MTDAKTKAAAIEATTKIVRAYLDSHPEETISPDDLRNLTTQIHGALLGKRTVSESLKTRENSEKELIVNTLNHTQGHRKKAAQLLEIGERTLYRKIKKYNIKISKEGAAVSE